MDSTMDYNSLSMFGSQMQMMDFGFFNNEQLSYPNPMFTSFDSTTFPAPALTECSPSYDSNDFAFDMSNDGSTELTPDLSQSNSMTVFQRPRGYSHDSGLTYHTGLELNSSSAVSAKILPSNVNLGLGLGLFPYSTPAERRHSMTPNRSFACPHCLKTFDRKFVLKRHMGTHRQHRPYQCQPCSMGFYRKDIFDRHVATKKCARAHLAFHQQNPSRSE